MSGVQSEPLALSPAMLEGIQRFSAKLAVLLPKTVANELRDEVAALLVQSFSDGDTAATNDLLPLVDEVLNETLQVYFVALLEHGVDPAVLAVGSARAITRSREVLREKGLVS